MGKILEKIGFCKNVQKKPIGHPHVLKSIIGLFAQVRTCFEEMDLVRYDIFFKDSLNLAYVPAKETAGIYLEKMIPNKTLIDIEIESSTIQLIKSSKLTAINIEGRQYLPVD